MKKTGFTLIELMGAVIILSLIALLAFPSVINMLKGANEQVDSALKEKILIAANKYVEDNSNDYPISTSNNYSSCDKLPNNAYKYTIDIVNTLSKNGYLDSNTLDDYNKNKDESEQINSSNKQLNTVYVGNIYYEKTYNKKYNVGNNNSVDTSNKKIIQKYCYKYGGDM